MNHNFCGAQITKGNLQPLGRKGGQHPIWPSPPLFMVHLSLPCPQYINLSAAIP